MAMNKRELAQFDEVINLMQLNRALRWSDNGADFDVGKPDFNGGIVNGWSVNMGNTTVHKSWSSSVTHGEGWSTNGERPKNASQNPILQYSTEEKALRALRHKIEMKFAAELLRVDKLIEKAINADH